MATLPEGMTIELAINKKTKELCWHVSCSEEYIKRTMLSILEKRIERAEIALPLCRHTKRKHRLTKLLIAMKRLKQQCITELDAIDTMNDEGTRTEEDFKKLDAKAKEIGAIMKETMMSELPTRLEGSK